MAVVEEITGDPDMTIQFQIDHGDLKCDDPKAYVNIIQDVTLVCNFDIENPKPCKPPMICNITLA